MTRIPISRCVQYDRFVFTDTSLAYMRKAVNASGYVVETALPLTATSGSPYSPVQSRQQHFITAMQLTIARLTTKPRRSKRLRVTTDGEMDM